MTIKTTNKALKQTYFTINTGYCNLQNLLNDNKKTFHNSGVYGWNWSAFIYGRYAILNSYRNTPKDDVFINRELLKRYDYIGGLINKKYSWKEQEKKDELKEKLIYRLIKQAQINK